MKKPVSPPASSELIQKVVESRPAIFLRLAGSRIGPTIEDRYRHWHVLRHLQPPEDLTHEEWWLGVKLARKALYQPLPFRDIEGKEFVLAVPPVMQRSLHRIDLEAGGSLWSDEMTADPRLRNSYLFRSLTEEAITSSQLEGASTTRRVAKEMIRSGRRPRTKGEWMIHNNYLAMQFVRDHRETPLTPALILELHHILTENTMQTPDEGGRYRRADEPIHILDPTQQYILHTPPPAEELEDRVQRLCDFANAKSDSSPFFHPVVRSILLHFQLGFDHPFIDGNGRTARALFYWSLAHHGYWLAEYISISRVIKQAPSAYARAFLYTETDDNDTTYFVLNQLRVISRALDELRDHLKRKVADVQHTRELLTELSARTTGASLNYRQLALLQHAMKNPGYRYTIASHRESHRVTYQTARSDLLRLSGLGLLEKRKEGKKWIFVPVRNLKDGLSRLD